MLEHNSLEGPGEIGGMEMQLASLYSEREMLQEALGTADAADIIAMVQSLEAQCCDLYQEKEDTK